MVELTPYEARILGCLIEKQITTPEYYPLTLRSLAAACNQKSNRNPVVDYDEKTVVRGLDGLREGKLVWMVHTAGSRVPKYQHRFDEMFALDPPATAIVCLLLLRGPQTPGEINSRSGRLHSFATIAEVERALYRLSAREEGPLVVQLPRQPGRKEPRWMHLLSGTPEIGREESAAPPPEQARMEVAAETERYETLKEEFEALKQELEQLRREFAEFKSQFE